MYIRLPNWLSTTIGYLVSFACIPFMLGLALFLAAIAVRPFVDGTEWVVVRALICPPMLSVSPAEGVDLGEAVGAVIGNSTILFRLYVVVAWVFAGLMCMLFSTGIPRLQLLFCFAAAVASSLVVLGISHRHALSIWMPVLSLIGIAALIYPVSVFTTRNRDSPTGWWDRSSKRADQSTAESTAGSQPPGSSLARLCMGFYSVLMLLSLLGWFAYVIIAKTAS